MRYAAVGTLIALGFATPVLAAEAPKDFVTHAIQGDNTEIKIGGLAIQKGTSAGVRSFGHTLVTDHTKAKAEMTQLASTLGMSGAGAEPKQANPEVYTKLSGLSGAAFDHAFVAEMVDDHKKDIADFQAQADSHNGAASELAAQQLPTLKKHLRMAEALQEKQASSR